VGRAEVEHPHDVLVEGRVAVEVLDAELEAAQEPAVDEVLVGVSLGRELDLRVWIGLGAELRAAARNPPYAQIGGSIQRRITQGSGMMRPTRRTLRIRGSCIDGPVPRRIQTRWKPTR
jgi:hypothetical protein